MSEQRIEAVLGNLAARGISQLLVCDPRSIQYLTGAYVEPGERFLGLLLRAGAQRPTLFLNRLFAAPADIEADVVPFDDTDDPLALLAERCDADAVLAVYPFTCQPAITQALVSTAGRPVLTGVAGSTTSGARSVLLAMESETQGVSGVVLNYGATPELVASIAQTVDVPVVVTITDWDDLAREKVAAGALVLNVAAGSHTPQVVAAARDELPFMPIIATAGPTEESARATVDAGADAISWTPPSLQQIEKELMARGRE